MSYRKIDLSAEGYKKIEKAFGLGWRTVHNALFFQDKGSDTGQRIRKMALELGGQVMVTLPECETFHIHGEHHLMEQRFPSGAVIVVDFSTGDGVLKDSKGRERLRKANLMISDLEVMQGIAAEM